MKGSKYLNLSRSVILAITFLLVVVSSANAATFVVNTTTDTLDATAGDGICADGAGACSLRAAITESNTLAGPDTINIPAGTYTQTLVGSENANAAGDWDVISDITIVGAGSATTILQSNAVTNTAIERVFHFVNATAATTFTASISGVTFRNGKTNAGTFGAGVRVESSGATAVLNITVSDSIVSDNFAQGRGGGFYIVGAGSNLIANNVTVTNNQSSLANTVSSTSTIGGAIYITAGTATFNSSTVSNNTASQATTNATPTSAFGGGLTVAGGTLNMNNSAITGNLATSSVAANSFGGGAAMSGGTLTLTNCMFNNNSATITAGANLAFAGAAYNQQATLNIINSTVNANTVSNTVTATNAVHAGIRTLAGTIAATTNITNSTVSNNTSGAEGGGVANFTTSSANSTVNITGSTISGNSAPGSVGGGIENIASTGTTAAATAGVNITNSTISGNTAGFGAGIINQTGSATVAGSAVITLDRSTVNNNTSTGNGGGIYNISFSTAGGLSTVNATNSTISTNTGANGGGLTNEVGAGAAGATTNLNFVTVASNTATASGGGLNQGGGTINLRNSIVADNTATTSGPDIFGTITSQDYNHVENTAGGTFLIDALGKQTKIPTATFLPLPNDVTGTDPALGALANNGGTTNTHLPAVASPVTNSIPNGTNDCGTTVTTSQNGVARPAQTGCEKGGAERMGVVAANASISGRVAAANGIGIRNAVITVTGGNLTEPKIIRTGAFGYYQIEDLEVGNNYILTINSKRFVFANPSVIVSLQDSIDNLNFEAMP